VLAQRRLDVVSEQRGPGFVALGAQSLSGRLSAVRVITVRGVVVAEDGERDDLFAPSSVELLEGFGPTLGEYVLVALTRTAPDLDRGCVSWFRILPDGSAVRGELDASALGSRACVAAVAHGEHGRLRATVAWPGLSALTTPHLDVELAFASVRVGEAAPRVPVARVASDGGWLEAERAQLEQRAQASGFSEQHALGVARAALALLAGLDRERQVGLYRAAVGNVPPGSYEAQVSSETLAHIERGWLDEASAAPGAEPAEDPEEIPEDAEVIEPGPAP
jgi:hypothetical protein